MDLRRMLLELHDELHRVEAAIDSLERLQWARRQPGVRSPRSKVVAFTSDSRSETKRRGRPRKDLPDGGLPAA